MSIEAVIAGSKNWHVEQADALTALRRMPDGCVQCCVTSPPYFQQRKYKGVSGSPWPEVSYRILHSLPPLTVPAMECCLGNESSPEAYIGHLVLIFRELRRVMRPDGVLWLNIGGSHAGQGGGVTKKLGRSSTITSNQDAGCAVARNTVKSWSSCDWLPKSFINTPALLAESLRVDGWLYRLEMNLNKSTPMPESVNDRPTRASERLYLMTVGSSYYYDKHADNPKQNAVIPKGRSKSEESSERNHWDWWEAYPEEEREDLPDPIWTWKNEPSGRDHYAGFPQWLPRRAFKLGTSERGCCADCGAPYKRMIEKEKIHRDRPNDNVKRLDEEGTGNSCPATTGGVRTKTLGWEKTCVCPTSKKQPCLVLDPFLGSGTSGHAARKLGLRFIGIELSHEYAEMSRKRIATACPLFD